MHLHTIFFFPFLAHVHLLYLLPHSPQISTSVKAYLEYFPEDVNAVLVDLGSSDVYMTQMIETYGKGYLYQQAMYKIVETYLSERVYIEY